MCCAVANKGGNKVSRCVLWLTREVISEYWVWKRKTSQYQSFTDKLLSLTDYITLIITALRDKTWRECIAIQLFPRFNQSLCYRAHSCSKFRFVLRFSLICIEEVMMVINIGVTGSNILYNQIQTISKRF